VTDAAVIEEAFQAKLATFATDTLTEPEISQENENLLTKRSSDRGQKRRRSTVTDKSALVLPEPRRIRDREHVRYVTRQSCLICGRRPSDAHHLRFAQNRALSRKVSDEFTVPYVGGTIAKFIGLAMKRPGGQRHVSLRSSSLVPYGWKLTLC
jgi:hypothetical protein